MDIIVAEGSDWCEKNCAKYREEFHAKQELITAMYEIAMAVGTVDEEDRFSLLETVMAVKGAVGERH